jgi:Na+/H+-dicarboxylate symporter
MTPWYRKLHWQILIAIAAGIAAGWLSGEEGALFGVTFFSAYDFVGTLFINALKMLIVPLIISSITKCPVTTDRSNPSTNCW